MTRQENIETFRFYRKYLQSDFRAGEYFVSRVTSELDGDESQERIAEILVAVKDDIIGLFSQSPSSEGYQPDIDSLWEY